LTPCEVPVAKIYLDTVMINAGEFKASETPRGKAVERVAGSA